MLRHCSGLQQPVRKHVFERLSSEGYADAESDLAKKLQRQIAIETLTRRQCMAITPAKLFTGLGFRRIVPSLQNHDQSTTTYEECSLLGYMTPVRTSQETLLSATESSRLMLFKI
jgi:hypothetical protein